jgi:hypothetical protein
MPIRIPPRHQETLAELMHLPQTRLEALLQSLQDAKPASSLANLAKRVAKESMTDRKQVEPILELLSSLYNVRAAEGSSVSDFVEGVLKAAEAVGEDRLKLDAEKKKVFGESLGRLLSLDRSLGVTAKARYIRQEHDNLFCKARILTDIRPVFAADPLEPPAAALISHTLRISYHRGEELIDFFVALDTNDLGALRRALERASAKQTSLEKVLATARLPLLDSGIHDG